ncbi:MAG TPA: cytochrome c3 family protein [Magnetococcales bacterium]|nr:cytochrome c3 family protein [Magnetococcales bacterium]
MLQLTVAFGLAAATGLMVVSGPAQAGIKGSKHDLGSTGGSQLGATATTTEVCVFCHTPHGSNTAAPVPLWNKSLPSSTYTRYSSLSTSTLDGAEATVGSVSLACLSCHDGSQAMDVMINAPGSNGYNAAGANFAGGVALTGFPKLGTDLSNDHPISIQYGGGGWKSTDGDGAAAASALSDGSFKAGVKSTINSNPAWWIDTTGGTANSRDKTDMVLYTRTLSGTVQPFVECASCHDPHNSTAQPVSFLRISNTGSAVCLACHDK